MQQIERYGVIALVFLLVTIVAVSFWGDNKKPGFWSRLTGRGEVKKEQVVAADPLPTTQPPPLAGDQALPLSPSSDALVNAAPAPAAEVAQPTNIAVAPAGNAAAQPIVDPNAPAFTPPVAAAPAPGASSVVAQAEPAPQAPIISGTSATGGGASVNYTVQKGDSLALIAKKKLGNEKRWSEIQALNGNMDPRSLKVGAKIKLPGDAKQTPAATVANATLKSAPAPTVANATQKSAPAATKSVSKPTTTKSGTYTVRAGDHLTSIAESQLGDAKRWKEIAKLNPSIDPNRLIVGNTLKLPEQGKRELVAAAVPATQQSSKPRVR